MQCNEKTSLSEALICSEFCAESQKFVMLHSPELSTREETGCYCHTCNWQKNLQEFLPWPS